MTHGATFLKGNYELPGWVQPRDAKSYPDLEPRTDAQIIWRLHQALEEALNALTASGEDGDCSGENRARQIEADYADVFP